MAAEVPRRSEAVESALKSSVEFLNPVTQAGQTNDDLASNIIARAHDFANAPSITASRKIVESACTHLLSLHNAIAEQYAGTAPNLDTLLSRAAQDLLDVIVVEGIYPSLSPQVGIAEERRRHSPFYKHTTKDLPDLGVLDAILRNLSTIVLSNPVGLSRVVRDRHMVDLLAALYDLAYSPTSGATQRLHVKQQISNQTTSASVLLLYKSYTMLLRPNAPEWFKNPVSENLSLLPLRPHGVQWAIEFIALSYGADNNTPKPELTHDILLHISKLLSSVPRTLDAQSYFPQLALQLTDILDGELGPELIHVAAFVITNGILSKKSTGSPGSIGWQLFVQPQHDALNPNPIQTQPKSENQLRTILTSQSQLMISLKRLWRLLSSNPTPALTGRLMRPLMLPLWGLISYDGSIATTSNWSEIAFNVLKIFLKRCGTLEHLRELVSNLFWDGTTTWTFGSGSEGGIEIRLRAKDKSPVDTLQVISKMNARISQFIRVVAADDSIDNDHIGQLFLDLHGDWYFKNDITSSTQLLIDNELEFMPKLVRMQLMQALLQTSSDKLAKYPKQMLQFVDQILSDACKRQNQSTISIIQSKKTSLADLSNIVQHKDSSKITERDQLEDSIATSISLLNVIITISENPIEDHVILTSILTSLDTISNLASDSISSSTKASLAASMALIKSSLDLERVPAPSTQHLDRETLALLNKDLSSTAAPNRTAAVKAIQNLISTRSVSLDVPTLFTILINQIRNESDEFVFLASISALTSLAIIRDAPLVLRTTVEAFADVSEATGVDGRLRVGESLSSIIQSLDLESSTVDKARLNASLRQVVETVLGVAGRRGKRTREARDRERAQRLERMKMRQAGNAGNMPHMPQINEDSDSDVDDRARAWRLKENGFAQSVLHAWENTGLEEDVRIRTSALSLLGDMLEHCPNVVTSELLRTTMALVGSVLSMETGASKVILRRAAILVYMGHLRAVMADNEGERLNGGELGEIERIVKRVKTGDEDGLVKSHADAVLEGIEVLRMKMVIVATETVEGGLETLRGLNIAPEKTRTSKIEEL